MLWLKRCVVLTLSHKVVVADVVYPAVLLAHENSIALLPTMVAGIQSGLRTLTKSFCQVEALMDVKGNPVKNSNGHPLIKTPSLMVELPYTYLMAWYVMHCPSLITATSASKGLVPFVQRLENSDWIHCYIFFIQRLFWAGLTTIWTGASPRSMTHPTGTSSQTSLARTNSPNYLLVSSGGWSTSSSDI